jgi:NAD+ diphosphatase
MHERTARLPVSTADFEAHMLAPEQFPGAPLQVWVSGDRVLVAPYRDRAELSASVDLDGPRHVLGSIGDRAVIAVDATGQAPPDGLEWIGLRGLNGLISDELWAIAARSVQVVEWDRTHRFCGRCGWETVPDPAERVRHCPNCGLNAYPRVSPAIIVLVTRGEDEEEALLAWGTRRAKPHYSTLAGFVEPGETLEQTLVREVREETGIEVDHITYFGSQSWPFPHQLMVGFRARYMSGEIKPQESEIRDARWFTPEQVEGVTASRGTFSIAGRLIDGWIAEQTARVGAGSRD